MNKKFKPVLKVTGSVAVVCGSTFIAYHIYKTRYVLSHIVKSDVLDRKSKPEYIYINDPHFHLMYEKNIIFSEDQNVKQSNSWIPALTGFWKSLKKSYCVQLMAMAHSEDRNDRLKAVQLLSKQSKLKDWECQQVAQMCDAQTAVGLARSDWVDLRFFLKPPYSHITPTKQELTDSMCNLLLALNKVRKHACIKVFLTKAFPEFKYRHIVFDTDLAAMELPQTPIKEIDILPVSIETLLHHSSIDDGAKDIVNLGGLPLIVELCKYYSDNLQVSSLLVNILANISAHDNILQDFYFSGSIGLLAKWAQHPNLKLSSPAARALANLDSDDNNGVKFTPRIHLLYPSTRHSALPQVDVVFIHGLLGGVFITWRQRDPEKRSVNLLGDVEDPAEENCYGHRVSDEHTLEYLEDVAQLKQDEWNALGSDYEMILSDCPENANECAKGPFSVEGCNPCVKKSMKTQRNYTLCWPQDWLPADCHHLRVIGINYDTTLTLWSPMCPVEKFRRNLESRSNELAMKLKQAGIGSRPIIWVSHSMGGLLVKKMLINAWQGTDEHLKDLCQNTKAVVFYSVPHRGSPIANLSQATQLLLWPSVEVQELQENSPALLKLHTEFMTLLEELGIEVVSFAETKPTVLSSLHLQFHFVPVESANPGIGEFFEIPQDHLCICKPDSRESFLYQKLLKLIQKHMLLDESVLNR